MGAAKYMVTIRFADALYPTAYFFNDSSLSVNFYNDIVNRHSVEDGDLYKSEVQLWKLEDEPDIRWSLLRTN